MKKLRVLVLGAGFGGLELSTILSEKMEGKLDLTLIDRNDSFFFGFSKFDIMFGNKTADAVKLYYSNIVKPGVKFIRDNSSRFFLGSLITTLTSLFEILIFLRGFTVFTR